MKEYTSILEYMNKYENDANNEKDRKLRHQFLRGYLAAYIDHFPYGVHPAARAFS